MIFFSFLSSSLHFQAAQNCVSVCLVYKRRIQTSSVVGQTKLDAIARKLVRVGSGHDVITIDARVDDLADAVAVGETDNKTVLGGVVLVLVLNHKTQTLTVISLTLTATTELGLETLEISLVLDNLLERHLQHRLARGTKQNTNK